MKLQSFLILSFLLTFFFGWASCHTRVSDCPAHLIRDEYLQTHGQKCYRFELQTDKDYNHASYACRANGGTLVTIKDPATQTFVVNTMLNVFNDKHKIWLGLNDRQSPGTLVWEDGTDLVYSNFDPSHHQGGNKHCVFMEPGHHDNRWDYTECNHKARYICEYDATNSSPGITPPSATPADNSQATVNDCPAGLIRDEFLMTHEGKCYRFDLQVDRDYDLANAVCKMDGGSLVTIKDQATQNFIVSTMMNRLDAKKTKIWLGLNDRQSPGTFVWEDGSTLEFSKFEPGHYPDDKHHCTSMTIGEHNNRWEGTECHKHKKFVCEYNIIMTTSTGLPTTSTGTTSTTTPSTTTTSRSTLNTTEASTSASSTTAANTTAASTTAASTSTNTSTASTSAPSTTPTTSTTPSTTTTNPTSPTTSDTTTSTTVTQAINPCPPQFASDPYTHEFEGSCFRLEHTRRNFQAALADCKSQGGSLALLKTRHLDEHLRDYMMDNFSPYAKVWIGLNDPWLTGQFKWTDGTRLGYHNFAPGATETNQESCVAVSVGDNGQWVDDVCDQVFPYVCQYNAELDAMFTTTAIPTTSASKIPSPPTSAPVKPPSTTTGMHVHVATHAPPTSAPSTPESTTLPVPGPPAPKPTI